MINSVQGVRVDKLHCALRLHQYNLKFAQNVLYRNQINKNEKKNKEKKITNLSHTIKLSKKKN